MELDTVSGVGYGIIEQIARDGGTQEGKEDAEQLFWLLAGTDNVSNIEENRIALQGNAEIRGTYGKHIHSSVRLPLKGEPQFPVSTLSSLFPNHFSACCFLLAIAPGKSCIAQPARDYNRVFPPVNTIS